MFRRPMMYITSIFAVAIIISFYYSAVLTIVLTGAVALFLFSSESFIENKTIALLLIVSMISGTLCFVAHDSKPDIFKGKTEISINTAAIINDIEVIDSIGFDGEASQYIRLEAKVLAVEGSAAANKEKILINYYDYTDKNELMPGKCINVNGILKEPDSRRNPGCFDYALYLRSVGIRYILDAENIEVCKGTGGRSGVEILAARFHGMLYSAREGFVEKVKLHAGDETAGLLRAIMFGDTGEVQEDILEKFRRNGTAHVLAVSGLHVGMIYGFLCTVWIWRKERIFFVVTIVFFLAYMVMASFSPSVVRAVIMVWIHVFAKLSKKRYDMASAAFFTALLMLVHEPMSVFNTGFQMSFLAVLTLSLILPVIKQFYTGIFMVSIAVQIGLAPYMVYVFNYISLAAVFVNVPVIILMGVIVPMGMCCFISMYIFESMGALLTKALGGLCMILEKLNSATCIEGITVFDVRSPDMWMVAAYYLILLVFVSEDGRLMIMRSKWHQVRKMTCVVIIAMVSFGMAAGNHFKNSDIVFVDVGQGDCIHIRTDKRISSRENNYLIDGGGSIRYEVGKKTLKPYLLKNGVKKIDAAFVTHLHTDHYKGIAELCRDGMVEQLYVYEGYSVKEAEIIENTGLDEEQIVYLYAGQKVDIGDNAYAEILWPDAATKNEYERMTSDEADENSLCLIMKVTVKNKSLLVTGDVDSSCLDTLAERYGEALDTDILKAAHHGSRYSESELFAEAAEPEYAVFQVGENNFGHPDEGVIENFRQKGIMIYRNDLDGAVAFYIGKKGHIRAKTVKGE